MWHRGRNKTGARRVGEFGSRAEARRFAELSLLASVGAIAGLKAHPKFALEVNGQLIGRYTADSEYVECASGKYVVEEIKGWQQRDYPLRKKLFKALYPLLEHREIGEEDRPDLFNRRRRRA